MSPILEHQEVIDKASIIENKERTKVYWEQMMMAAADDGKSFQKMGSWGMSEGVKINGSGKRNSKILNENANICTEDAANCFSQWDVESELIKKENSKAKEFGAMDSSHLSMEGKIALELQEMKEREEELREWRNKIAIENCKEISIPKVTIITNGNEDLSSLHTTDDSNYSEYGSEEKEHSLDDNSRVNTPHSEDFIHLRTQSLDSVSSGHSSGSGLTLNERDRDSPRRRVVVRPFEDPEEEHDYPCYAWDGKETPIEKEIRLAREREEELRREKGTAAIIANCRELSRKVKTSSPAKETVENDPRGIQHRLATSRIQQEIEEANERERELRMEGKIILTSEETLDSKVTRLTQLVENSITENKHREMKRSLSTSHLLSSPISVKPRDFGNTNDKSSALLINRKSVGSLSKKGVMQQFFSAKGKPFSGGAIPQYEHKDIDFQTRPVARRSVSATGDVIVHTRKGYTPVAEKIQEELKDNQKREEELRLQRARLSALARSQPNLLDLSENEDEHQQSSWTSQECSTTAPRLVHSMSNPNLLDDTFDQVHKRPTSKKFSLLEEWEKRIKENINKE